MKYFFSLECFNDYFDIQCRDNSEGKHGSESGSEEDNSPVEKDEFLNGVPKNAPVFIEKFKSQLSQ